MRYVTTTYTNIFSLTPMFALTCGNKPKKPRGNPPVMSVQW